MASAKALAAIALMIVIVAPIGLGYLSSLDTEEVESWQTTSSSKISDMMLNHQTPYYGSYKGTSNNSALLDGDALTAPTYITSTSAYTSLPIYTETVTTVTLSETSYVGQDLVFGVGPWADEFGADSPRASVGTHDYYKISTGEVMLYETGYSDITDYLPYMADGSIYLMRSSPSTWTAYTGNTLISNDIAYWVNQTFVIGTPPTSNIVYKDLTELTTGTPYSGYVSNGMMKVDNDYTYGSFSFQVAANAITINGTTTEYDSLPSIYVAQVGNIGLTQTAPSGSFADPSDGWTVPNISGTYYWINNQVNNSVTFYVKPVYGVGQYCTIGDLRIQPSGTQIQAYVISEGVTQTLGAYDALQVVVSADGYDVTGLAAWPTMGIVPSTYNSIHFDAATNPFYEVKIQASSQDWHFRVDNANIQQGTYPSTYDYTLNLQQVYPDTNIDIYLNSIGVYGDYINIGGANCTVTNGSITINGTTYRLLHAHISAWQTGTGYSVRINGDEIATTAEPPTIFFGGEWSITATAYKIESVQQTTMVWHAGEFGFSKTGFAMVGLIICAAAFVALGMTGQRSGAKVGLLLLICGGAAVAYLIIA